MHVEIFALWIAAKPLELAAWLLQELSNCRYDAWWCMCRTFHTTGLCPYGPRCHFIHNDEERRSSTSTDSSTSDQPLSVTQNQVLRYHVYCRHRYLCLLVNVLWMVMSYMCYGYFNGCFALMWIGQNRFGAFLSSVVCLPVSVCDNRVRCWKFPLDGFRRRSADILAGSNNLQRKERFGGQVKNQNVHLPAYDSPGAKPISDLLLCRIIIIRPIVIAVLVHVGGETSSAASLLGLCAASFHQQWSTSSSNHFHSAWHHII